MADARVRAQQGVYYLRGEDQRIPATEDSAYRIENMVATDVNTLRTTIGPCPVLFDTSVTPPVPYDYGEEPILGICHAFIRNEQQELLLIHVGEAIYEYQGWNRTWAPIIGPSALNPKYVANISSYDGRARAPTQFIPVPNGVIIVPQIGMPLFYDGDIAGRLGYANAPGSPEPIATITSSLNRESSDGTQNAPGLNDEGYAFDALGFTTTGVWAQMGKGRVGTVEAFPGGEAATLDDIPNGTLTGQLLDGEYRAVVQWLDRWGNLSPISGPSSAFRYTQQRSRGKEAYGGPGSEPWLLRNIDDVLKFCGWKNVQRGPTNTVARIVGRTKDLKHSGTTALYELPPNVGTVTSAIATVSDNYSNIYPDNTPDSWLTREMLNPVPVTGFRYGVMAFGRFWAGNWDNDAGRLHPSVPGKWGTFLDGEQVYPDSQAGAITGLYRTDNGLLVFSRNATMLITRSDRDRDQFTVATLSATVGCVAPNSIAALPTGSVVWLARDGFYALTRQGDLAKLSDTIEQQTSAINWPRAIQAVAAFDRRSREYRCWVPINGQTENSYCFVFDGKNWRRRTDMIVSCVAVSQGDRDYMFVGGSSTGGPPGEGATSRYGVWILDHQSYAYDPAAPIHVVETSWMGYARVTSRTSPLTISIWMREYSSADLQIDVFRDGKESPIVSTQVDFANYEVSDVPPFWGTAELGADETPDGTPNTFRYRRGYTRRVDIAVPAAATYKVRLSSLSNFEFIAVTLSENPKDIGGARISP